MTVIDNSYLFQTRVLATLTITNASVIGGRYGTQVKGRLDNLWSFLRKCPSYGLQYQWAGLFLANLIRLTMKVSYDLNTDLQAIIQMELPQTSATLLQIVFLDFADPTSTVGGSSMTYAEKFLNHKNNEIVRDFVRTIHKPGTFVAALIPSTSGRTQKQFPHLCTRPITPTKKRKFSHCKALVNLEQTIQELKQEIQNQTPFAPQDVSRMRSLALDLHKLLHGNMS